jgi:hypothetical protein
MNMPARVSHVRSGIGRDRKRKEKKKKKKKKPGEHWLRHTRSISIAARDRSASRTNHIRRSARTGPNPAESPERLSCREDSNHVAQARSRAVTISPSRVCAATNCAEGPSAAKVRPRARTDNPPSARLDARIHERGTGTHLETAPIR